jgi:hypothetical protein
MIHHAADAELMEIVPDLRALASAKVRAAPSGWLTDTR